MLVGGARRGSGDTGRAPARLCGGQATLPSSALLAGARPSSRVPRHPLRPSALARRWRLKAVAAALCALRWPRRSLYSLPPPAQVSFKSAPALAAARELINMQNQSVTH